MTGEKVVIEDKLVSVIIPTYNRVHSLMKSINSVLNQKILLYLLKMYKTKTGCPILSPSLFYLILLCLNCRAADSM